MSYGYPDSDSTAEPIPRATDSVPPFLQEIPDEGLAPGSRRFRCDWRHNSIAFKWLQARYADIDVRPDVPGRDPAVANFVVSKERKQPS
jgi:hypothetical protein